MSYLHVFVKKRITKLKTVKGIKQIGNFIIFKSIGTNFLVNKTFNCHFLVSVGVGIVLITVSGIAWRLTSTDAPSCRAMLGLGGGIDGDDCNGRFLTRPNAMAAAAAAVNYGRPQHPYAGK